MHGTSQDTLGQGAAFLFYFWIWTVLIFSVWNAIAPHSIGSGCFLDVAANAGDKIPMTCEFVRIVNSIIGDSLLTHAVLSSFVYIPTAMIRTYDIAVIGFLGYAYLGGAQIANIAYVLILWLLNTVAQIPMMQQGQDLGCPGTGVVESKLGIVFQLAGDQRDV